MQLHASTFTGLTVSFANLLMAFIQPYFNFVLVQANLLPMTCHLNFNIDMVEWSFLDFSTVGVQF